MLSDLRCRSAKPKDKDYKIADEKGLYLFVTKAGYKSWRMKYRINGEEKRLTFGPYPEVSLIQARALAEAARALKREGIDPAIARKLRKAERHVQALNTFEVVARRWHVKQALNWTPRYAQQVLARFDNDVFPELGALPITDVSMPLVIAVLRKVVDRGAIEGAHRIRQHMSDIFMTAVAEGIATADPAARVQKALEKMITGHRPAVITLPEARAVLAAIEAQPAYGVTKLASRLLALTATRPGAVREATIGEFEDLDGPEPIWSIPAARMKLTTARKADKAYDFVVPLASQAVEAVRAARQLSDGSELLFPSVSKPRSAISDSTLSALYRTAGFAKVHVPHGWRSTFSTIMNTLAAVESRVGDREVIDLMLAHLAAGVEPIYNRYAYLPRRRAIAQEWADLLMAGAAPAESLIELGRGTSPRARRRAHERAIDRRDPRPEIADQS